MNFWVKIKTLIYQHLAGAGKLRGRMSTSQTKFTLTAYFAFLQFIVYGGFWLTVGGIFIAIFFYIFVFLCLVSVLFFKKKLVQPQKLDRNSKIILFLLLVNTCSAFPTNARSISKTFLRKLMVETHLTWVIRK